MSCTRIIGGVDNHIAGASLTSTSQRGSSDIRLIAQSRRGRGRMVVNGPYTGAADSTVDVEVLGGTSAEMRASTPVISGVGNGALTISAIAPGAVAETLTFSLLDAGSPAQAATLEFYGTTLGARQPGAAGNALTLSVARHLTITATPYSTLSAIAAGTAEFAGPEWDWGGPASTGAGIPDASPRLQFAGQPQVFRAWKTWADGKFTYRIDPPPAFEVPADTAILSVSGDYTLTLSDGVTDEVYAAVTLYEFLTQVQARSALVEVLGTVAPDRAPGGMAVTDIPLRTDAHALPVTMEVQSRYAPPLTGVSVAPNAPTENITITCAGRVAGNTESWTVRGAVSGVLRSARTGEPYSDGPISFTIPAISAPIAGARIGATYRPVERNTEAGEGLPAVCFNPLRLGAAAVDGTYTYIYERRPPADCNCAGMSAGTISDRCLDLEATDMSDLAPAHQSRLIQVYAWRSAMMATQTDISQSTQAVASVLDMDLIDRVASAFAAALGEIYDSAPALAQWDVEFAALPSMLDVLHGVGVSTGIDTMSWPFIGAVARNRHNNYLYRLLAVDVDGEASDIGQIPFWTFCAGTVTPSPALDAWATSGTFEYTETCAAPIGDTVYTLSMECVGPAGDLTTLVDAFGNTTGVDQFVRQFSARMDHCRALAGIVPKSNASTGAGDGCWQDDPSATHWWVSDSDYAPAFTNRTYVSSRKDAESGGWFSTHEFGFGLVVSCPERLKPGDMISVTIQGTGGGQSYVQGDRYILPIVAAQDAQFGAGADGDDTHTWTVRGSASGALDDWAWSPSAPTDYTDGPITAQLAPGGIPFEAGDSIAVDIEGGRYRWRRDGGAWTEADLFGAPAALGDGLTLAAEPGPAPSFLAGDSWSYKAVATHGLDRLRQPRPGQAFAWTASSVVLDIDLGSVQPVPLLLLALHTLPEYASVMVSGGDAAVGEWVTTPAVRPVLFDYSASRTARYLRLSITGTPDGGSIGWLYAGAGWEPTVGPSELTLIRKYDLLRGQGLNPAALYRGRGTGGRWAWDIDQGGGLLPDNAATLLALVDHSAQQGAEPVALIADVRQPASGALAIIDADEVVLTDTSQWQYGGGQWVGVDLPFRAVIS